MFLVFMAALLFTPADTLRYWQAWLFLAVFAGCTVPLGIYFVIHDPALVERRMKVGPAAEQEPVQKIAIGIVCVALVAMLTVPGFDRRWHWSDVPAWLTVLAECVIAASFVIFFYVMKQNSFAAATVRVERDQTVISTGLYGVVRHPMYMGHAAADDRDPAGARLILGSAAAACDRARARLAPHRRGTRAQARPARLRRVLRARALAAGAGRLVTLTRLCATAPAAPCPDP